MGCYRETIKNDRYGNFYAAVCTFSPKRTGGRRKAFFILLPGRIAGTIYWLWPIQQSADECGKRLTACELKGCVLARVCDGWSSGRCPDITSVSGEEGRVTDRPQWLVELGRQNLSVSAEAMNHFSLQLCNLSPLGVIKWPQCSLTCTTHSNMHKSCASKWMLI